MEASSTNDEHMLQQVYNMLLKSRTTPSSEQSPPPNIDTELTPLATAFIDNDQCNSIILRLDDRQRHAKPTPITMLPDELLLNIFQLVEIGDLEAINILPHVCLHWESLIITHRNLWKGLPVYGYIAKGRIKCTNELNSSLLMQGILPLQLVLYLLPTTPSVKVIISESIRRLVLDGRDHYVRPFVSCPDASGDLHLVTPDRVHQLGLFSSLQQLSLTAYTLEWSFVRVLQNTSSLNELRLSACDYHKPPESERSGIVANLANLRKLRLPNSVMDFFRDHVRCPRVQHLRCPAANVDRGINSGSIFDFSELVTLSTTITSLTTHPSSRLPASVRLLDYEIVSPAARDTINTYVDSPHVTDLYLTLRAAVPLTPILGRMQYTTSLRTLVILLPHRAHLREQLDPRITIPNLERLEVTADLEVILETVSAVICPKLSSLSIVEQDGWSFPVARPELGHFLQNHPTISHFFTNVVSPFGMEYPNLETLSLPLHWFSEMIPIVSRPNQIRRLSAFLCPKHLTYRTQVAVWSPSEVTLVDLSPHLHLSSLIELDLSALSPKNQMTPYTQVRNLIPLVLSLSLLQELTLPHEPLTRLSHLDVLVAELLQYRETPCLPRLVKLASPDYPTWDNFFCFLRLRKITSLLTNPSISCIETVAFPRQPHKYITDQIQLALKGLLPGNEWIPPFLSSGYIAWPCRPLGEDVEVTRGHCQACEMAGLVAGCAGEIDYLRPTYSICEHHQAHGMKYAPISAWS